MFSFTVCGFNLRQANTLATQSSMYGITLGDFNQDTRLDIAIANFDRQNVGVFLANSNNTFAPQQTFATGAGSFPYWVVAVDINNDTRLDMVVANFLSDNVGIFLGNGDGTFAPQITMSTGGGSRVAMLVVADVNRDNQLDIITDNFGADNVGIFLGRGNGDFASQMTFSSGAGSQPYFIAAADLNQDDQPDIVVANSGTNTIGILLGFGNGTFALQTTLPTVTGSQPYAVVVGDFNQDTRLDIVVANYGVNNIGLLLGNGDGTFASMITFSTGAGSRPYLLAMGDLNRDNRLDVVVANFGSDSIGVLFRNNTGIFSPQITFSTGTGSRPIAVVVGDVNQDGRLDVVSGNYGTETVSVFLSTC